MRKTIVSIFCLSLICIFSLTALGLFVSYIIQEEKPIYVTNLTVVLDAGHGAEDGGCVGSFTEIKESDLNLIYTKKVGEYLTALGIKVVYTRENDEPVYSAFDKDKKISGICYFICQKLHFQFLT